MTPTTRQTAAGDAAVFTVEAVASLLKLIADCDHDKGNMPMVLTWLGRQLETAGMVLSGGVA